MVIRGMGRVAGLFHYQVFNLTKPYDVKCSADISESEYQNY